MTAKQHIINTIYRPLRSAAFSLAQALRINRRKVVIVNRNGYGDSPKYIVEELRRHRSAASVVWIVDDMSHRMPRGIRKCHLNRIPALFHLATARVVITTDKGPFPFAKKPGQYVIYIPHGAFGGKFTEGRAPNLNPGYVAASKWHSSVCDLFISPNTNFSNEMRRFYWYSGEIMESGLPRNDIFFRYTPATVQQILRELGLPSGVSYLLYAPTFRDRPQPGLFEPNLDRLLDALERRTGRRWMGLVTWHPNFCHTGHPDLTRKGRIVDVSHHPDMQQLLLIADMLVSDYSSTVFDFALTRRPVLLFTPDLEAYRRERGLYDWFFKVPFPFCRTAAELAAAVGSFDATAYAESLRRFFLTYGSVDDGNATSRLAALVEQKIASGL